jgi:hypothetical protein
MRKIFLWMAKLAAAAMIYGASWMSDSALAITAFCRIDKFAIGFRLLSGRCFCGYEENYFGAEK